MAAPSVTRTCNETRHHPSYCPTQKSCAPVSAFAAVSLFTPPPPPPGAVFGALGAVAAMLAVLLPVILTQGASLRRDLHDVARIEGAATRAGRPAPPYAPAE